MPKNSTKLGCIPIDAIQSLRKVYDQCNESHRVTVVPFNYNVVSNTYNSDGTLQKADYYYDTEAEETTIVFTDDCCGNLDGKSFNIYSGKNETHYVPWYNLGTAAPCNTCCINYICISLCTNDPAPVVALATKLAFACITDFSVQSINEKLIFTASKKGDTTDASDVDTGFCISVTNQGSTCLVETISYTYDSCNRVTCITSLTGENYLNIPHTSVNLCSGGSSNEDIAIRTDSSTTCCVTYVGEAAIGAAVCASVWKVYRITCSCGDVVLEYADSNDNYDNSWANRACLTYG